MDKIIFYTFLRGFGCGLLSAVVFGYIVYLILKNEKKRGNS